MANRNPEVRLEVVRLIRDARGSGWVAVLIQRLVDEGQEVRQAAREALDMVAPGWPESEIAGQALPILLGAINSADPRLRAWAVQLLETIKDPRALPSLLMLLRDPSEEVYRGAVTALDRIMPDWRDSEAAGEVLPAFVHGLLARDAAFRDRSGRALRLLRHPAAIWRLLGLQVEENREACIAARAALDEIAPDWQASEEATERLRAFADLPQHSDRSSTTWAVEILPRRGHQGDAGLLVRILQKAFREDLKDVWDAAGQALERIGREEPQALEELLASHEDPLVRETAASALGQARTPREARLLDAVRRDPDPLVRSAAARSLGRAEKKQAFPVLLELLHSEKSSGLREALVWALGELGTDGAVASLGRILSIDEWYPLRVLAAVLLGRMSGPRAHDMLRQTLAEQNLHPAVRFALYLQVRGRDPEYLERVVGAFDRHRYDEELANAEGRIQSYLRECNERDERGMPLKEKPLRSPMNDVARAADIKSFLLSVGYDFDAFLSRIYARRNAEELALLWEIGGFWRQRAYSPCS
jgi:HEAT repeat protein